MNNNRFFKGAVILVVCNLIGKVLGAVYRIPLAKIVGAVGMGQYQLVFPLYTLILTVSTSGIPTSISKLVAEFNSKGRQKDTRRLLFISILILTFISIVGFVVIVLGAKSVSALQGNSGAYICYYGIAPAVLFVGVLSAFRGYFQGNLLMFPTAISGLIEQVFKIVAGLSLALEFSKLGVEYGVFGALLGVSVSEFISFVFLFVCYLIYSKKHKITEFNEIYSYRILAKNLLVSAVPITLGGLISPITSLIDSLLIVNVLMFAGFSSENATVMLGVQSGVVEPLVNIPVILAVSISTVILPNISYLRQKGSKEEVKNLIEKGYQTTLSIALACAVCFVVFGEQIITFLYGSNFDFDELLMAVKLLMLGSLNVVALSLVQVSASVLQGLDESNYSVKMLVIGCILKIVLDVLLVRNPSVNIFGATLSGVISYFLVFMFNYFKIKKLTEASVLKPYFYVSIQTCFVCLFAFSSNTLFKMIFSSSVSMFASGLIVVMVFLATYYVFFMQEKKDVKLVRKIN